LKVPLSGHLETLSNRYWDQALLQRKMSFQGLRSGVRRRAPRLDRRHPNGESEGTWNGTISIVRPELREDMTGIHEVSDPQERVEVGLPGGMYHHRGPTVLRDPVPGDKSEPRPSAIILRK
jgi:hypothetical protein